MTRERHLLRHYIFQTNEGDVVVASKQNKFLILMKNFKIETMGTS
jgi:hypothetical protein